MSAIWMRLRAEARAGWRAWLSLALLIGIAGGAATAAAAGARRTESAYPRFLRAQDGFHAMTGGGGGEDYATELEEIRALPEVGDSTVLIIVGASTTLPAKGSLPERELGLFESFYVTDLDGRTLYETNRAKILEGRLPDLGAVDEVSIPFTFAEKHGLAVGDRVFAGIGFDPESFGPVEIVPLRVVGIRAAPGDFEALGQQTFPFLSVTPALYERYRDIIPPVNSDTWNLGVHLRDGPDVAQAFKQKIDRTYGLDVPLIEPVTTAGVQETMRLYVAALWIVAAVLGIAAIAVFGQTLSRQMLLDASDYPALRALGISRRQLFGLGMLRGCVIAVLAAPIVVGVAAVASPLLPVGAARIAEPDPGFAFDGVAIGLGVLGAIVLILAAAVLPAWRAARAAVVSFDPVHEGARARPSGVVGAATRMASGPSVVTGLRMALEPGRGRSAVPVRSTILAVAIGLAAVTGALVVGRSLQTLIDTPALAGLTYDAILPSEGRGSDAERAALLARFDFIEATSVGTGLNIVVDDVSSFIVGFAEGNPLGFAIIEGRTPTMQAVGDDPEIAIGPGTAKRLGLRPGDTIEFELEALNDAHNAEVVTQRARVVGTAAIPPLPWEAVRPGEGGVMVAEAIDRFFPDADGGCCFVRFVEGTDLQEARVKLEAAGYDTFLRTERADLATLEEITELPALLTALFGVLALAALVHVLVTGIRRRRRDLAILKTIGFVRRQVRVAVAWQATAIGVLCLAVGLPAGVILGRWGWDLVADRFGVVPVVSVPALILALVLPVALVLANVIAALPARAAAQTQPALALRSE